MAADSIFSFLTRRGSKDPEPEPTPVEATASLADLFSEPINMPPETFNSLHRELEAGLVQYTSVRDARLAQAMAAFDEDMRKALFEIIFLLHVNHPRLANIPYESYQFSGAQGARKKAAVSLTADLYMEGAPHGVRGIQNIPAMLLEPMSAYVNETFGMPLNGGGGGAPVIMSISSGGSIGTIGHKSGTSDLDLNVQYDLAPFLFDPSKWSDQTFSDAINAERDYWIERARRSQNLMPDAIHDPSVAQGLSDFAERQLKKNYPRLWSYFSNQKPSFSKADLQGAGSSELRGKLMAELMLLMKRSADVVSRAGTLGQEKLLRARIDKIQDYITSKFPSAEIYLFPTSNSEFRHGRHASTLETKESPGSAYELLLNYETVLPGIQFTSLVPTHHILSQVLNSHPGRYGRFVDYIRFGLLDVYKDRRGLLVDLGATPDLTPQYVAKHHGAVYWEAFKASSGNLPKATLNLLRIEMLLDERFPKSSIQMMKQPDALDHFIPKAPKNPDEEMEAVAQDKIGLPNWMLLKIEAGIPALRSDPWWLRYKSLKIAYGPENHVEGIEPEAARHISKIIDLAFALHVRISDVFTNSGSPRSLESYRERVLFEFNRLAFPEQSPRRTFLERMFAGEVREINQFEHELREIFKDCLERVEGKIAASGPSAEKPSAEFEIWHHYYQQNFEPAPNVIQRAIMNHLKVPRGRIQAAYDAENGWKFRSLQRESSVGKRIDTYGSMNPLPDEVVLHEHPSFLSGLAHCILNGYYGTVNRGTLNERRTALEFDATSVDLGHEIHNTLAFVRPDQVERIMERMHEVFPYQQYDYLDCVRLKQEITEVFVFLNLLSFGRLSILYRDNMQTWYCDEFDHPEMLDQSDELSASAMAMITAEPVHKSLGKFFRQRNVRPKSIGLAAWVNPNSVNTTHGHRQHVQKETELAGMMLREIMKEHGDPYIPPPNIPLPKEEEARAPAPERVAPPHKEKKAPSGTSKPAVKSEVAASDWKGRYEQIMKRMGVEVQALGAKGRHRHPKFRPKSDGRELSVQAGDASGKLISFSADSLSFTASEELPAGKEIFVEIDSKVIVRARIVGCERQEGEDGGPYRVNGWLTNEEQGYRCFVLLASEISGTQS